MRRLPRGRPIQASALLVVVQSGPMVMYKLVPVDAPASVPTHLHVNDMGCVRRVATGAEALVREVPHRLPRVAATAHRRHVHVWVPPRQPVQIQRHLTQHLHTHHTDVKHLINSNPVSAHIMLGLTWSRICCEEPGRMDTRESCVRYAQVSRNALCSQAHLYLGRASGSEGVAPA